MGCKKCWNCYLNLSLDFILWVHSVLFIYCSDWKRNIANLQTIVKLLAYNDKSCVQLTLKYLWFFSFSCSWRMRVVTLSENLCVGFKNAPGAVPWVVQQQRFKKSPFLPLFCPLWHSANVCTTEELDWEIINLFFLFKKMRGGRHTFLPRFKPD